MESSEQQITVVMTADGAQPILQNDVAREACKIQQNCKLLPHRAEFAFGFNAATKRPLARNKRNNKYDNKWNKPKNKRAARFMQATKAKRPAEQFRPGANREFQFHEYALSPTRVHSRFRERINNVAEFLRQLPQTVRRISLARSIAVLAIAPYRLFIDNCAIAWFTKSGFSLSIAPSARVTSSR